MPAPAEQEVLSALPGQDMGKSARDTLLGQCVGDRFQIPEDKTGALKGLISQLCVQPWGDIRNIQGMGRPLWLKLLCPAIKGVYGSQTVVIFLQTGQRGPEKKGGFLSARRHHILNHKTANTMSAVGGEDARSVSVPRKTAVNGTG